MRVPLKSKPLKRHFVEVLQKRLQEKAPLIQVVLGPRQVGKTTGVQMIAQASDSIHYATADDTISQTAEWITEQWQAAKLASKSPVLIIDEVQKVMHWSDKIKALWDAEKVKRNQFKLILLGSSSLSLSRGLEESLAGRFEVIPVPHWGFRESRLQFGYSLEDYLLYGGYPASAEYTGDFTRWQKYLKNSIIETVIGKDILRQVSVRKPALFRQTFELLSAYPARTISYNKLLGQLQDQGNTDLVKHYIELFEGAFLFKALQKYSGSVVSQRSSSPKILPLCPSLYSYRHGSKEIKDIESFGFVFEAAVGAELAKLSGELFYWREKENVEVDFIYVSGKDIFAVEVKSGRKKGSRGLDAFLKGYPKAKPVFVTPDNFELFSKDPVEFLTRVTR